MFVALTKNNVDLSLIVSFKSSFVKKDYTNIKKENANR